MYPDGGGEHLDLDSTTETFVVFRLDDEPIKTFNPRTGRRGYLELQTITNGPIFLFRGTPTQEECEQMAEGQTPQFALAAAIGQASQMKLEENPGEFTVYGGQANTVGFVRILQCD